MTEKQCLNCDHRDKEFRQFPCCECWNHHMWTPLKEWKPLPTNEPNEQNEYINENILDNLEDIKLILSLAFQLKFGWDPLDPDNTEPKTEPCMAYNNGTCTYNNRATCDGYNDKCTHYQKDPKQ